MLNNSYAHYEEETGGFISCLFNRVRNFFKKLFDDENDVIAETPEVEKLKQVFRDYIVEKPAGFEDTIRKTFKPGVKFVIDASVTSVKNMRAVLKKIGEDPELEEFKIILTSVTIHELQMLQKGKDSDGYDARFIMNHAIEHGEAYELVQIPETEKTPDACIIKFCVEHKRNIVLLTSDKEMALDANLKGVNVLFFKQPEKKCQSKNSDGIVSLYPTRKIGNQLFTGEMQTAKRAMMVITQDGKEYSQNICELHLGDDILIASLKDDCLIFVHYKLISMSSENNAQTLFSRRYYATDEIDNLESELYKNFLGEFIKKHNINF